MTDNANMCLPWTWFMSVYMQLSIALPFGLYLYCRSPRFGLIAHAILVIGSMLSKYLYVSSLIEDF